MIADGTRICRKSQSALAWGGAAVPSCASAHSPRWPFLPTPSDVVGLETLVARLPAALGLLQAFIALSGGGLWASCAPRSSRCRYGTTRSATAAPPS